MIVIRIAITPSLNASRRPLFIDDVPSEQLFEFFDRQACVTHDAAHRECVDGIMARDGEDAYTVGHDDVLTLTNDAEARLLQSFDRVRMIDAGNLRHG